MTLPLFNYSANGAKPRAPQRFKLSKTFDGASTLRASGLGPTAPYTCALAFNIEAPAYAIRVGFANPFNADSTISKATIWPSSTFADFPISTVDEGTVGNHTWVPTGGGTAAPLYFDNAGADLPWINTAGTQRAITLAANAANASNVAWPLTYKWSDFVPLVDLPRADGGAGRILMLFLTMGTAAMCSWLMHTKDMYTDITANRGRTFYAMQPWLPSNGDFADNPAGSSAKYAAFFPTVIIQYLTLTPGYQLLVTGDSLSGGNPTPCSAIWRAAMDLSTSSGHPIEVASTWWGGTDSTVWVESTKNNYAAIQPSLFVPQALSHNDNVTVSGQQMVLAKLLSLAHVMNAVSNTPTVFTIPGLVTNADGGVLLQNGFYDIVGRLKDAAQSGNIGLYDGTTKLSNYSGGAPWDYIPGVSTDNVHPSTFGCELGVADATAALRLALGLT